LGDIKPTHPTKPTAAITIWNCGNQLRIHSLIPDSTTKIGPRFSVTVVKVKGIVRRILRGVNTKLEARPFFFLNFKGIPSQEEHKTVFSGLKIKKMALFG
jgi:hypothetical protein